MARRSCSIASDPRKVGPHPALRPLSALVLFLFFLPGCITQSTTTPRANRPADRLKLLPQDQTQFPSASTSPPSAAAVPQPRNRRTITTPPPPPPQPQGLALGAVYPSKDSLFSALGTLPHVTDQLPKLSPDLAHAMVNLEPITAANTIFQIFSLTTTPPTALPADQSFPKGTRPGLSSSNVVPLASPLDTPNTWAITLMPWATPTRAASTTPLPAITSVIDPKPIVLRNQTLLVTTLTTDNQLRLTHYSNSGDVLTTFVPPWDQPREGDQPDGQASIINIRRVGTPMLSPDQQSVALPVAFSTQSAAASPPSLSAQLLIFSLAVRTNASSQVTPRAIFPLTSSNAITALDLALDHTPASINNPNTDAQLIVFDPGLPRAVQWFTLNCAPIHSTSTDQPSQLRLTPIALQSWLTPADQALLSSDQSTSSAAFISAHNQPHLALAFRSRTLAFGLSQSTQTPSGPILLATGPAVVRAVSPGERPSTRKVEGVIFQPSPSDPFALEIFGGR